MNGSLTLARCGVAMIVCLGGLSFALAEKPADGPVYAKQGWSTIGMAGVQVDPEKLKAMQQGDYILHAKDGRLKEVPAVKTPLPVDPCGHVQRLALFVGPDGTIYAAQCSVLSRSADGGKTWTHLRRDSNDRQMPDSNFMRV